MKITKRSLENIAANGREYFVWDEIVTGFGVRVSPRGRKSFIVQYRSGGRTRRMSLGAQGALTPDEARNIAKSILGDVARGTDPAQIRARDRRAANVSELCERFMKEHVALQCKPTTQREYQRCCDLFIRPVLGGFKVQDVTRADVANLHHSLRDKPYQANRVLGVLSKMFNLAELWGLRPDGSNPTRHVHKNRERKRERFLSPEEISALWSVLDKRVRAGEETPQVAGAFKLLLLTGCRLSEIQFLKWTYIRGDVIWLPDAKTGPRRVLLSRAAMAILAQLFQVRVGQYVIAGAIPGEPITDLQRPWRRIRAQAGIADVRIHDLRHTYASIAAMAGHSLPMIGRLLGHTQAQSTARYAHLADATTRAASDTVNNIFESFVDPNMDIGPLIEYRPAS
ncbi:tyrosine-type recombinase/integrase [Hyphococcus formosus]|uniref:tyrosine-type recombinase/integrase n=1 Tax=Hyphococcus formosus TaxID=3143534 RepID=UPI00398A58C9